MLPEAIHVNGVSFAAWSVRGRGTVAADRACSHCEETAR